MIFAKRTPKSSAAAQDAMALQTALDNTQALIWFDLDGTILDANENFLGTLGYDLEEIKGKHHRMLVQNDFVNTSSYQTLWKTLADGLPHKGEIPCVAKGGHTLWIEASYAPLFGSDGKPAKIVSFATDVTKTKEIALDAEGQISAISNSQAMIEFDLDGTILTANQNFLSSVGYTLDEIIGRNQTELLENSYANSAAYKQLWEKLATGEFQTSECLNLSKDGEEIWFSATYTPALDAAGTPAKIIKIATDITNVKLETASSNGQLAAISKVQAIIEFDVNGHVLTANKNFLSTMGYSLDEVVGKHHRMFLLPEDTSKPEYNKLWGGLREGKFQSGQYKRVSKIGAEVWIRASYNPILDPKGRVSKIVKYAIEVTESKNALNALVDGLSALSEGDLSARLPATLGGEFSGLREAFNKTLLRLEDLVSGILSASESIANETNSIAQNATDLSTRGERQAATVEETSAAMEEISVTVASTVENAKTATNAAEAASQQAKQGGSIVTNAVEAMSRIETSTGEISKIVEVIDGIAFQTNLLALNAGVEAARAGDAGRGFAVVASEVRALAHRSSESAREINDLITKSNKEVSEGSALVNSSGQALTKIVSGVTAVVDNISEILKASQEQASGITEVTEAVAEIDRTTQHTAGLADESATAANQLAERAANLRELVSFFGHGAKTDGKPAHVSSVKPIKATPKITQATQQPVRKTAGGTPVHTRAPVVDAEGWEEF